VRIAVTGASGFLGPHLIRAASARGIEVVGIVRKESARSSVIESGGRPVRVPGLERSALREAFSGSDAVVHLAQISGERGSLTYAEVNVQGTRNVLEACRAEGVPRVVLLSGLGVARYGISPRSTNGYFLSKLAAEVEAFRSGLEAVVFRPSYIAGRGDALMRSLLTAFKAANVTIVGDGLYRLQPVAVRDACEAILRALTLQGNRVFDLVGPEPLAYRDFVARVARVIGKAGERVQGIPVSEAEAQARAGGFQGLLKDELDVLLCDEVSDPRPLEALLGGFLTPLDDAIIAAVGP
jgi:nucleoside-diphosphate-sugar epimerase